MKRQKKRQIKVPLTVHVECVRTLLDPSLCKVEILDRYRNVVYGSVCNKTFYDAYRQAEQQHEDIRYKISCMICHSLTSCHKTRDTIKCNHCGVSIKIPKPYIVHKEGLTFKIPDGEEAFALSDGDGPEDEFSSNDIMKIENKRRALEKRMTTKNTLQLVQRELETEDHMRQELYLQKTVNQTACADKIKYSTPFLSEIFGCRSNGEKCTKSRAHPRRKQCRLVRDSSCESPQQYQKAKCPSPPQKSSPSKSQTAIQQRYKISGVKKEDVTNVSTGQTPYTEEQSYETVCNTTYELRSQQKEIQICALCA